MSGLKGTCPLCGTNYYGWALESPHKQSCPYCGSALEIRRDGVLMGAGISSLFVKAATKRPDMAGG
jgi:NAD-dependent SIR2 family protein deacetylase